MGSYNHYLWLGIWSSLTNQQLSDQRDGFESIVIFADGEPLRLELEGWTLASIGVSQSRLQQTNRNRRRRLLPGNDRPDPRNSRSSRYPTANRWSTRTETYEPWDNLSQGLSGIREFVRYRND